MKRLRLLIVQNQALDLRPPLFVIPAKAGIHRKQAYTSDFFSPPRHQGTKKKRGFDHE